MTARDLLLELLAENLPAACVPQGAAQLKKIAAEEFGRAGVACGAVEAYGTCRRLALCACAVPGGTPTKALAAVLPRLVGRLEFPETMTWEESGFRFPRPLRGLTALHGEKLVRFSLAGLESGRVTEGHDAAGPRRLAVPSAEKYLKTLEHAGVLVKDAERLEVLRSGLASSARRMKLEIEAGDGPLAECLYSAEYPVPVVSGFSQEFLQLPPERVRRALKACRLFPVCDAGGRLQPYFAGVRDGVSKGQRNVEEGFRSALEAALSAEAAKEGSRVRAAGGS